VERVCVYAGSNVGVRPEYTASAERLARVLVAREIDVVFGGGNVGLMKVVADTAMTAGGSVIGIMPEALMAREIGHPEITELRVVGSMHERKAMMADLSDGFIALPGGLGTLEEFVEIATWAQLGLHAKPFGLLDVAGFYAPLVAYLDYTVEEGFLRPRHRAMMHVAEDADALLDAFAASQPPPLHKWIDLDDT
jgi:uncharacterized protein (TIGR00730 family)